VNVAGFIKLLRFTKPTSRRCDINIGSLRQQQRDAATKQKVVSNQKYSEN